MALQSIKEAQEDSATQQKSAKEEDFTTKSAEVSFEWLYTILNCQSECLRWTFLIQVKWLALNLKTLEVDFITHIIYLLLYDIKKKKLYGITYYKRRGDPGSHRAYGRRHLT